MFEIDLGVSVFLQFDLLIYFYHHVVFEKGREAGLNEIKVSLNRNGLIFKKIIMNTIYFNEHDVDIFINGTWQKYAGSIG
jgi:hypothetical protein